MSILQLQQQLKSLEASPSGAVELTNCWRSIQLLSEAVFFYVFSDWKILPLALIFLHILLVCIEQMLKWFELNLKELEHLWRSGTISLGYFSCLALSILFCHFAQYKTGGLWGLQPKVHFLTEILMQCCSLAGWSWSRESLCPSLQHFLISWSGSCPLVTLMHKHNKVFSQQNIMNEYLHKVLRISQIYLSVSGTHMATHQLTLVFNMQADYSKYFESYGKPSSAQQ